MGRDSLVFVVFMLWLNCYSGENYYSSMISLSIDLFWNKISRILIFSPEKLIEIVTVQRKLV